MKSKEPTRPLLPSFVRPATFQVTSHSAALEALKQAVSGDEPAIDLGLAALIIAADHYPRLDIDACMRQFDSMADEARKRIGRARKPERVIAALNAYLFDELGFRGNEEDYYSPDNSFLNKVLEARSGLPITLSIIYVAVAQRLGLPVCGVGLPLHFIARCDSADARHKGGILIDPFHGGEILTPASCQERLERILGRPVAFDPAYLQPTPNRLILYRLLNNLKQAYLRREEPERAGQVVEQMLVVMPDSADDIRDRGLLYLQERRYSKAIAWLTRYLDCVPDASDAARIHRAIDQAYHLRARLN